MLLALFVALAYALGMAVSVLSDRLPGWVAIVAGVMCLVAFVSHALDKRAAGNDARRTPEFTLHLWELLGGWPGALLARHMFGHKTAKTSYKIVFWLIAAVNAALVFGVLPIWLGGD